MKIRRFNFYSTIYVILIMVIVAALLTALNSCELVNLNALRPDDLPDPEPIEIDTTVVDTIITPIDTHCTDPVEIITPAFVTLYVEFDILEDSIRWQGGQVESYDIRDVIEAVTSNPYTVYHSGKSWAVIIDGTNDNQSFYLKIFARSNGAKVYMGAIKQGFIFAGALTFDQFRAAAIKYPSVDRFNFRNTQFDSIQYVQLADIILGDCKEGRTWADFRFNPFEMDPAIITEFENAGWQTVLH